MLSDKVKHGKVYKIKIDKTYEGRVLDGTNLFPYDECKEKTLYLVEYENIKEDKGKSYSYYFQEESENLIAGYNTMNQEEKEKIKQTRYEKILK